MVKQQQMRSTQRGEHLLLQVRTHVLNEDLREIFGRWYPGMQTGMSQQQKAAYPPLWDGLDDRHHDHPERGNLNPPTAGNFRYALCAGASELTAGGI
jgi:hypothetical protein